MLKEVFVIKDVKNNKYFSNTRVFVKPKKIKLAEQHETYDSAKNRLESTFNIGYFQIEKIFVINQEFAISSESLDYED